MMGTNMNIAARAFQESTQRGEQTIMPNHREFFGSYGTQQSIPLPLVTRSLDTTTGTTSSHDHQDGDTQNTMGCFPELLFQMLNTIEQQRGDFSSIVSWHPSGAGFVIHIPDAFVRQVMPVFFRSQSKLASFMRQLNNYGFQRVAEDRGGGSLTFYHRFFLRDHPGLCQRILLKCKKIKILTKAPTTTMKAPDTTMKAPDATMKALDAVTKALDTTTKARDTTMKAPDTTTKAPDTTTKAHDTTTKAHDTTTKAHDTTAKTNHLSRPRGNVDHDDDEDYCSTPSDPNHLADIRAQLMMARARQSQERSTASRNFIAASSRTLQLQDLVQQCNILVPEIPPRPRVQGPSRSESSRNNIAAAMLNSVGAFSTMPHLQHPVPESYLFTFLRYFEDTNETREMTIKAEHSHESMMHVVTRVQSYPDTEVLCFSKTDRRAIRKGTKKIVFKLPQVHGGAGATFSKLQFGEMTVLQALQLTPERPMRIEILTHMTIEGKNIDIF